MTPLDRERLQAALQIATAALLAELSPQGHWVGELSASALSTATAVVALCTVSRDQHAGAISLGLRWLATNRNADGGWGDTIRSKSNISTTALVWAAFGAAQADADYPDEASAGAAWLCAAAGGLEPRTLTQAIAARYGRDRTFSVPILMTLALAGRLGPRGWRHVPALPFELAALPHQVFGALQLPVVSYALPALIAIGQAIHHHAPTRNPLTFVLRTLARCRTLRVLASIQPPNGGFLEATPLTSFVTMSLASAGRREHAVVERGVAFLLQSMRPDGSWPIDTNLATWTTTLAVKALAPQRDVLSAEQRQRVRAWLLGQQHRIDHPYTHAAPGGWAWTDLPGGVPDADDTPGALLALLELGEADAEAGAMGVRWLLDLQNRDGGIPTFCRGWGALPFDRSSPDLTAHTLRAWRAWRPHLPAALIVRIDSGIGKALHFLRRTQRADGAWLPLWFGNEHAPGDENPTYGTAHVVLALREIESAGGMLARGEQWLVNNQNDDGSWGAFRGCVPSIEETALAVEALCGSGHVASVDRGAAWLVEQIEQGTWRTSSPIGFYFAKLWYWERLYPLVFTVGALGRVLSGFPGNALPLGTEV